MEYDIKGGHASGSPVSERNMEDKVNNSPQKMAFKTPKSRISATEAFSGCNPNLDECTGGDDDSKLTSGSNRRKRGGGSIAHE
jgi:hypothetical protein